MSSTSNTLAKLLGKTASPKPNLLGQQSTRALDLALLFDTTASMYCYLAEVRDKLSTLADEIYRRVPQTRIAVVAYADYDEVLAYVTKVLDFTADIKSVRRFVTEVEPGGCGHSVPEAVEEALFCANQLGWTVGGRRAAVLVGDAPPHGVVDSRAMCRDGHFFYDEAEKLGAKAVPVYTVQCGSDEATTRAFRQISSVTKGKHLSLGTVDDLVDLLIAICMREVGLLESFANDLREKGRLSTSKQKLLLDLRDP
jgi:Mg-chelatase subunit ChlD